MKSELSSSVANELCDAIRFLYSKGWSPGTGGNYSFVINREPLVLLMAPSGIDKGSVTPERLIEVNESCELIKGVGKVSAEAALHVAIAKLKGATCILHTHSVANTVLSTRHLKEGEIRISGFEMLKTLGSNTTHEREEVLPIVANSQDMNHLSKEIVQVLGRIPDAKGILLAGHGLYTWGDDIFSARRHVEGFEFLLEVLLNLHR